MNKGLLAVTIVALLAVFFIGKTLLDTQDKLDISIANTKAYQSELAQNSEDIRQYKMSIEELNYLNDSISIKLKNAIQQLGVKDSQIKSLQYTKEIVTKTDTIVFTDTIFKDISIDTTLQDRWYKLDLGLHYPNTVVVSPQFVSEKIVLISTKKETVNPPKKCFLLRWFQKKHTVTVVDIQENNPYIEQKQSRFIEISK